LFDKQRNKAIHNAFGGKWKSNGILQIVGHFLKIKNMMQKFEDKSCKV